MCVFRYLVEPQTEVFLSKIDPKTQVDLFFQEHFREIIISWLSTPSMTEYSTESPLWSHEGVIQTALFTKVQELSKRIGVKPSIIVRELVHKSFGFKCQWEF